MDNIKVVDGKRFYVCPLCGKLITTRNGLRYHLIHTHNLTKTDEDYINIMESTKLRRGKKPALEKKINLNEDNNEIPEIGETKKKAESGFTSSDEDKGSIEPEGAGIEEAPLPKKSEIEELKSKLLDVANEGENEGESESTGEGEGGEIEAPPEMGGSIELDEEDIADLYLNALSFIAVIWGVEEIAEDKIFQKRALRRAKILHKVMAQYVDDADTIAIIILVSDVISDVFYIYNYKKEKEKVKE